MSRKLYRHKGDWVYEGKRFWVRDKHLLKLPVMIYELWRLK